MKYGERRVREIPIVWTAIYVPASVVVSLYEEVIRGDFFMFPPNRIEEDVDDFISRFFGADIVSNTTK